MLTWLLAFLVSYIVFFMVSVPLHELGHMVCGLLTGYRFSLYRIGSLIWVKEGGRVVRKRSRNKLIAGQCLMIPPEEADFRYGLYNLGGGLANLLLAALLWGLFAVIAPGRDSIWEAVLIGGIVVNVFMGLMNLVPMSMGGLPNDGMNILMALRSKAAKHGLYVMLWSNHQLMEGKRFSELDPAAFEIGEEVDRRNYLAAYPVFCQASYLYDVGRYAESIAVMDWPQVRKLPRYYRGSADLDALYFYCVHQRDAEKARAIYADKGVKKLLAAGAPTYMRIAAAYDFFILEDEAKGRAGAEKAMAALDTYENPGIVRMERDYLADLVGRMDGTIDGV